MDHTFTRPSVEMEMRRSPRSPCRTHRTCHTASVWPDSGADAIAGVPSVSPAIALRTS